MRIDTLKMENFKLFERQSVALHEQFTLLVGENGSGKTTILDALAVAAGIWLVNPPDTILRNSGRNILPSEIRVESEERGDRTQFIQKRPVVIGARGTLGGEVVTWTRQIRAQGQRTTNLDAKEALRIIAHIYQSDEAGAKMVCPVLAYYGAGRAWISSNERIPKDVKTHGKAQRWAAFYDCFNERIRPAELREWFLRETTAAGNRGGKMRAGFEIVRRAILSCVPDADAVWYDADRREIVLSIAGCAMPFNNLSAGQRMMLALVADLAIRAVTQNAFLVPADESGPSDGPLPRVLAETPGLVLIDELDVHLHPRWQRRVASDLKRTFPSIQFVCTSHSPQMIGELPPAEIRLLKNGEIIVPDHSYGVDSNRVLEELMGAKSRNHDVEETLRRLAEAVDRENFVEAKDLITELASAIGKDDPEVTRANTLLKFLESTP